MQPLKKGDVIAFISPASFTDYSIIEKGRKLFEDRGYCVKEIGISRDATGRLSGSDETRLNSLHKAFLDKEVKAIVCTRGGYGSGRISDRIDRLVVEENPKIFVGYSDITNLLCDFSLNSRLTGFHGPMVTDLINKAEPYSIENFFGFLEGKVHSYELVNDQFVPFAHGQAEGTFFGGNISILQTQAGVCDLRSKYPRVIFLEDVGEFMYGLDRSLVHLKKAGLFDNMAGLVVADLNLKDPGPDNSLGMELEEVLDYHFSEFDCPIAYNIPAGHTQRQLTLPYGTNCKLSVSKSKFVLDFGNFWHRSNPIRLVA